MRARNWSAGAGAVPADAGTRSVPGAEAKAVRLKVGALAKRAGLTVRTLHHWDGIGLLVPGHRSASGHRLYDEADLLRLQQILSLRQLGIPLEAIRDLLDAGRVRPLDVLEAHLARVREQLAAQRELVRRLERVTSELRSAGMVSAGDLILTVEAMHMYEKYYTPEQLEQLRQRGEHLGAERIREVEEEWPRLIAEVRAEMERGSDPAGERMQALARRWQGLVEEFTGGDPGITDSLSKVWKNEPVAEQRPQVGGLDGAMFEYVGRAMAALKTEGQA
jgi:DNA-binding transcriptional MerR regulator